MSERHSKEEPAIKAGNGRLQRREQTPQTKIKNKASSEIRKGTLSSLLPPKKD